MQLEKMPHDKMPHGKLTTRQNATVYCAIQLTSDSLFCYLKHKWHFGKKPKFTHFVRPLTSRLGFYPGGILSGWQFSMWHFIWRLFFHSIWPPVAFCPHTRSFLVLLFSWNVIIISASYVSVVLSAEGKILSSFHRLYCKLATPSAVL